MAARRFRFKILKAKISGFWTEYKRSRAGMFGLLAIAGFVFVAIFGPSLAPNDPIEDMVAGPIAIPQWLTILPEYRDWPPSLRFNVQWETSSSNVFDVQFKEDSGLASMLKREELYVWSVRYVGSSREEVELKSSFNFTYNYGPPHAFKCTFRWLASNLSETGYNLELTLIRYGENQKEYSLWDSNFKTSSPERSTEYLYSFDIPGYPAGFPRYVELGSGRGPLYEGRLNFTGETEFLSEAFSSKCNYALAFYIRLNPKTSTSTFEAQIFDFDFDIRGKVHGALGTDDRGRDIFSRILYGARVSLFVGLLVATVSTSIGVIVGTISGYLRGFIDEAIMRIVDLLMCLPLFPLLLAAGEMFDRNLFILIFLIIVLRWMPLARMVRSQVLSLREASFIEAAIAAGCTRFYILRKHILPNVLPLTFTSLILSVPYSILLESALSFLELSDPRLITWGRIIKEAMGGGAMAKDAWWWLFSPGIVIVLVCLGFVFISRAFDNIVNPRLRARK